MLDCNRSDIGLKWSEGGEIYITDKEAEGCNPASLENVARALRVFQALMGDIAIEATTPEIMKDFMRLAVEQPVKHQYSGKVMRKSGPKVANHHRKELLTVARYLRSYTSKVKTIPFEHVPKLPEKPSTRTPVPQDQVKEYVDALPPHTQRPVLMVLVYGLRSSAVCNLTLESVEGNVLVAHDKNDVTRRIPIDDFLAEIIEEAKAMHFAISMNENRKVGTPTNHLFLNMNGRGWSRMTLLHAAQRAWVRAGLEKKKIHEIRHTLGTLAGKDFEHGKVQAAMGHRSRKSSEAYFHPNEDMAAEVRQKIVTELKQTSEKTGENEDTPMKSVDVKNGQITCPHCGRKVFISK